MNKIFKIDKKTAVAVYLILDTLLAGMGRFVPFFCILFGFPVGWYLAKRLTLSDRSLNDILTIILKYAFYTSFITFILMLIVWGPISTMLMDPNVNFANFGMPLILFYPKISFMGWIILMIFISPFLQLLATVFTSQVTLWRLSKKGEKK